MPRSVVVKARRPEDHGRNDPDYFRNEQAALEFLTSLGFLVAPRLFAVDDRMGLMVREDSCPTILDEATYAHGLTTASAAWTILRAGRIPKLENIDGPHRMGFSRRGQLLNDITTTIRCSEESNSLRSLAGWFRDVAEALRVRWPHLNPSEPLYPAFRAYGNQ